MCNVDSRTITDCSLVFAVLCESGMKKEREELTVAAVHHMSERTEATPPHRFVLARMIETKMVICPIRVDVYSITKDSEACGRVD